jgi:hypothetical protein
VFLPNLLLRLGNYSQRWPEPLRERAKVPMLPGSYIQERAQCSDDRDRVYVLRSISSDGGELVED